MVLDDCQQFLAECLSDPVNILELLCGDDGQGIFSDAADGGEVNDRPPLHAAALEHWFFVGEVLQDEEIAKVGRSAGDGVPFEHL